MLLFDGDCVLCNGTVRFVHARAPAVGFASQTSDAGRRLLTAAGAPTDLSTVVLLNTTTMTTRVRWRAIADTLALMDARGWRLLGWLMSLVPALIGDVLYRVVGSSRYWLFGRVSDGADGAACTFVPSLRRMSIDKIVDDEDGGDGSGGGGSRDGDAIDAATTMTTSARTESAAAPPSTIVPPATSARATRRNVTRFTGSKSDRKTNERRV